MHFFIIIALIFTPFLTIRANSELEKNADLNLRAGLFENAAKNYQILLNNSNDSPKKREWIQNLASCFYYLDNFQAILPLLEPLENIYDTERLYLGTAYTHLGRFEDAVQILTCAPHSNVRHEMNFERGCAYLGWNKFEDANRAFGSIPHQHNLYPLAQIYRVKTALKQNNNAAAQSILDENPDANPERAYLQGLVAANVNQKELAQESFETALSSLNAPWARDTLIQLSQIYLDRASEKSASKDLRAHFYDKAIESFRNADSIARTDDLLLAWGNALIAKGDEESLSAAKKMLLDNSLFNSKESQNQALFSAIQTLESFEEKDSLYRKLTHEKNSGLNGYGTWWLHRGINDLSHSQTVHGEIKEMLVRRALSCFENAVEYLSIEDQAKSKIWIGRAYLMENTPAGFENAKKTFASLIPHVQNQDDLADVYYLYGQALDQGAEANEEELEWLKEGLLKNQSERSHLLLGILHYKKGLWRESEQFFSRLFESSDSGLRAEALFWAAKCAYSIEGANPRTKIYLQKIYTEHPHSAFAPEAYFTFYTYKEYLQGDKEALKHLQQFSTLFPDSPYILNAHYLLGLDHKKERSSSKKIKQRDLNAAIEAFNHVEEEYVRLAKHNLIPKEQTEYAERLYYYAVLERALANLAVADQSEGAKQEIFLQYSQDLLKKMTAELKSQAALSALEEEAQYWLAKVYHKGKEIDKATETLQNMFEQYSKARVTRGYFLSRSWYELGNIHQEQKQYQKALDSFEKADESGKGGILTMHDRLDLWIQKSICYRGMQDYDQAIRILTQVTHENVISALRLKAMYLRSELYALQNRPELERNQLIALSKKGGEWASKARQTLEEKYGY